MLTFRMTKIYFIKSGAPAGLHIIADNRDHPLVQASDVNFTSRGARLCKN